MCLATNRHEKSHSSWRGIVKNFKYLCQRWRWASGMLPHSWTFWSGLIQMSLHSGPHIIWCCGHLIEWRLMGDGLVDKIWLLSSLESTFVAMHGHRRLLLLGLVPNILSSHITEKSHPVPSSILLTKSLWVMGWESVSCCVSVRHCASVHHCT
jgi:hypothetical protein